ncbi:MAG: TRAP transporter large permease subunit [Gammaproteobacteria bacterium]|jgi:tripartite ATP-independent transporter DctM subunit
MEWIIAISLFVLAILGAPLFAVILAAAVCGFYLTGIDLAVIAIELYRIADIPLLIALPLFTFAGYILSESNTSHRVVDLSRALFGWIPDELAIVTLVSCALFTAFTGATGVTIVALGALLLPALREAGYGEKYSTGLVTTSGSLGLLLPPSLPLILYVIIVQQMDIGEAIQMEDAFKAGILPSLLMIALLVIWSRWATRHSRVDKQKFSGRRLVLAFYTARWELPLPFILLGGIYGGYFAVSEAAAVTALYALIIEVFIYKEVRLKKLPDIIRESMLVVGGILLILAASLALTNFIIDAEIPSRLFDWIRDHISSKLVFLIVLNLFLLVLGAFLDIFSALVLMVPLILPLALGYGIHPLHLGIIFLANMQVGYFTPPVGMNLFIASYRFEKPISEIYASTIPFMLVLLLAVLIITYWPALSLAFIK